MGVYDAPGSFLEFGHHLEDLAFVLLHVGHIC